MGSAAKMEKRFANCALVVKGGKKPQELDAKICCSLLAMKRMASQKNGCVMLMIL